MSSPEQVMQLLRSGYTRTALLLVPQRTLGREGELAVRLGIGHVDYQCWKMTSLDPNQKYLMYSAERFLSELDELCTEHNVYSTVLVSKMDLPLAAVSPDQRRAFWSFLLTTFNKRPRALLLALSHEAAELLLDDTTLSAWLRSGRLARLAE